MGRLQTAIEGFKKPEEVLKQDVNADQNYFLIFKLCIEGTLHTIALTLFEGSLYYNYSPVFSRLTYLMSNYIGHDISILYNI